MIRGGRRKPSSFFFARDKNGREIAREWRDFQRRLDVPSEKPHPSRSGMDRPSGLSSGGSGRPMKREKAKLTLLTPFSRNRETWAKSSCINTRDSKSYRLNEISRADVITLGNVLCGYIQHPEIKSLGPDGEKCSAETRGLLRRIPIRGGLHHPIGKEISRFEQGQDDFIENIEDACIRYGGGRGVANETLKAEIRKLGLRKTTKETGLDRKTIRAVLSGKKVKVSTLAKVVNGFRGG